ncbi:MAG: hypothetical protein H0X67_04195 [Acidobacteria bacterium]|nr:hypothetical protein [Acidobacteriota bacterium]
MAEDPKALGKPVHASTVRKGEDILKDEGKEPGPHDAGKTGADRPAGTSEARDSTRINPEAEDPIDPQSPKLPPA